MMNILLLLLSSLSDPCGDKLILDHLEWSDEGIVLIAPISCRKELELEWQEPRPHRLLLLRRIRHSHDVNEWLDGCDTAVFFWTMQWEDWDQNPYCDSFLEVVE